MNNIGRHEDVGRAQYQGGGGGYSVRGKIQILVRQNLCYFLKMSEKVMYASQ